MYFACVAVIYFLIINFYRTTLPRAVYAVVVCLSVCMCVGVSVTLWYCIKTAERRIKQITPLDSPVTLVFRHQSSRRNSNGIIPYVGIKCRWGGLKFATFDEKRAITRKRYMIDAQFLLKSNKKSNALYQMAMFPILWVTPNPQTTSVFAFFDRRRHPLIVSPSAVDANVAIH